MLRPAFVHLFWLSWPLLASSLVYKCNFDGRVNLKEQPKHNLSSSKLTEPLAFVKTLPPSRDVSHSCIVTTGERDSLLRVKAKAFGETSGKVVFELLME